MSKLASLILCAGEAYHFGGSHYGGAYYDTQSPSRQQLRSKPFSGK
jgi:hypothetical protein